MSSFLRLGLPRGLLPVGSALQTLKLLIIIKNPDVLLNTRKTKYMEMGRHRVMIANEHISIGSNSYEKVKNV